MSDTTENILTHIRVVLVETSHPGNIGAAARAMKTMGFSQLVLVNPRCEIDAVARARASGAVDVLDAAQVCADLSEALADCTLSVACTSRRRDLPHPSHTPRSAAPELLAQAQLAPVALVFGSETFGLTNEQLSLCRWIVSIPGNPHYLSLNLAQAVQVMVYELRASLLDQPVAQPAFPLASHAAIEGVERELLGVLGEIGFYDPAYSKKLLPRLRRFFARAGLEKQEAAIWHGMLANIRRALTRDN
jgi:tRNA/rRNA methyltransferase